MRHLVRSFQQHTGYRGVHFYNEEDCNFLPWNEVFAFLQALNVKENPDVFAEKLTESLANYDPNKEFLAVCQKGDTISVELYSS